MVGTIEALLEQTTDIHGQGSGSVLRRFPDLL